VGEEWVLGTLKPRVSIIERAKAAWRITDNEHKGAMTWLNWMVLQLGGKMQALNSFLLLNRTSDCLLGSDYPVDLDLP